MRSSLIVMLVLAGGMLPAAAQSVLDGPLAAPDSPTATKPATPARAKPKVKKPRHAASKPTTHPLPVDASSAPAVPPAAPAAGATLDDPVSLGMKWQGNSDSASQTRSQNLDGTSFGSGAEVGMKLHF